MTQLKISDSLSARSDLAQNLVQRLFAALEGMADGVDFGTENSVPTIELWLQGEVAVMTVKRAIAIGRKLAEVSQATVHFQEMRAQSVVFFVYSTSLLYPGVKFPERVFSEYGMPLETWANAVLADS